MRYFAGLDVSLEETTVCVVDDGGLIVREARAASEPEALVAFFRGCGLVMERVGLEACSLTAWLHQGLTEAGIVAICIEARQAKAAMGAMPNKTDRNDARGKRVRVTTGAESFAGVTAGLSGEGLLRVQREDGGIFTVIAGDVEAVR